MNDELSPEQRNVLDGLQKLVIIDPTLAAEVGAFPWLRGYIDAYTSGAIQDFASVADSDTSLAGQMIRLPWLENGANQAESWALHSLSEIAEKDLVLASAIAEHLFTLDGVDRRQAEALQGFAGLAQERPELARGVAAAFRSWLVDGVDQYEAEALQALAGLAKYDIGLASEISQSPWLIDGVERWEARVINALAPLARQNADLAKVTASMIGSDEDLSRGDASFVGYMDSLAQKDTSLAFGLLELPWIRDGMTVTEVSVLGAVSTVANQSPGLAANLSSATWFLDGMTDAEAEALIGFAAVAKRVDVDAATALADAYLGEGFDPPAVASALNSLGRLTSGNLQQVMKQEWFSDGLTEEETALMVVLAGVDQASPELFQSLLRAHPTESTKIDLPLAGEITLTIIRHALPSLRDPSMQRLEEAVTVAEELMGIAFPKSEVILLLQDPGLVESANPPGGHFGTYMTLSRSYVNRDNTVIAHETAHYYWRGGSASWLIEGGASFLSSYVVKEPYRDSPSRRNLGLKQNVSVCRADGVDSIQDLIDDKKKVGPTRHHDGPLWPCNYYFGESLLTDLFDTMGEQPFRQAWTEIYLAGSGRSEEEVYRIFLSHSPLDKVDQVKEVYANWHGGDFTK
ncbi:MAG: hypothetical protein BZY88_15320 [SAR202 cluster bacterium Io17-Chloro-G9]|nr:MAG: hypothetical protein BZY88_15320 [SAR202 cluster bacterium Io17-Chloro-G9]